MLAVVFVEAQTIFDDLSYRILVIDTGEFAGKLGVTAELAPQLDAEPSATFSQGAGWTRRDTPAAFMALIIIYEGDFFCGIYANGIFLAGLDTSFTHRARPAGYDRRTGADDTDVFYLWLGACIRTIGQSDSKFMVKLDIACNGFF